VIRCKKIFIVGVLFVVSRWQCCDICHSVMSSRTLSWNRHSRDLPIPQGDLRVMPSWLLQRASGSVFKTCEWRSQSEHVVGLFFITERPLAAFAVCHYWVIAVQWRNWLTEVCCMNVHCACLWWFTILRSSIHLVLGKLIVRSVYSVCELFECFDIYTCIHVCHHLNAFNVGLLALINRLTLTCECTMEGHGHTCAALGNDPVMIKTKLTMLSITTYEPLGCVISRACTTRRQFIIINEIILFQIAKHFATYTLTCNINGTHFVSEI